ncbi:hypothetical protein JO861_12470 [Rhodococcus hoagii]|uniref:hypothetical protein n=1 Tax=Rhodococcus hoagii TaxID=43767 RepID=UPI0011A36D82|nr:hypothetical protein [Prescottella equi]MBM9837369.1 hypothetical protein [Prescottella equi]
MTDYRQYQTALADVSGLAERRAAASAEIERRFAEEVAAAERERRSGVQQWKLIADSVSELEARGSRLSAKVGIRADRGAERPPLPAGEIERYTAQVGRELARAEESWQWVLRHRERARQAQAAPAPTPVVRARPVPPSQPPAPVPPPPASKTPVGAPLLFAVGAIVILLILLLVVIIL